MPITSVVLIDSSSSWFVTINPNLLASYLHGPLPTVTTVGVMNVTSQRGSYRLLTGNPLSCLEWDTTSGPIENFVGRRKNTFHPLSLTNDFGFRWTVHLGFVSLQILRLVESNSTLWASPNLAKSFQVLDEVAMPLYDSNVHNLVASTKLVSQLAHYCSVLPGRLINGYGNVHSLGSLTNGLHWHLFREVWATSKTTLC